MTHWKATLTNWQKVPTGTNSIFQGNYKISTAKMAYKLCSIITSGERARKTA